MLRQQRALCLAILVGGLLTGCGDSGSPAEVPVVTPPSAAITGVTTPKSVSVVTANGGS